ncbi:hypothetical protein U0070_024897 [Myodes glareolus]|uniref:Prolactin receptor n=1 Tax=Myodes glareolus TaxID=447135 RepID=A0AAW0IT75_MYOGA
MSIIQTPKVLSQPKIKIQLQLPCGWGSQGECKIPGSTTAHGGPALSITKQVKQNMRWVECIGPKEQRELLKPYGCDLLQHWNTQINIPPILETNHKLIERPMSPPVTMHNVPRAASTGQSVQGISLGSEAAQPHRAHGISVLDSIHEDSGGHDKRTLLPLDTWKSPALMQDARRL